MVAIYHNPRCSKSRETLALLEAQGIQPEIHRYLDEPPSATELADLVRKLGFRSARELLRTKEADYKALGLADTSLSEAALIQAMLEHPKLIERPIVVNGKRAALGRPPENVLQIL